MQHSELDGFNELWVGIYETYGKTLTTTTLAIFFDVLKEYSFEQVRDGLKNHLKDPKAGSFVPRPSDIVRFLTIDPSDGRVGSDVAWSMIPHSESESTAWTDEIAGAYGVCLALINQGDLTAARMAFREEYNRLVKQARIEEKEVKWIVSLGEDESGRESAIIKARELNTSTPNKKSQKRIFCEAKPKLIEPTERERIYSRKGKTKTLAECKSYLSKLEANLK